MPQVFGSALQVGSVPRVVGHEMVYSIDPLVAFSPSPFCCSFSSPVPFLLTYSHHLFTLKTSKNSFKSQSTKNSFFIFKNSSVQLFGLFLRTVQARKITCTTFETEFFLKKDRPFYRNWLNSDTVSQCITVFSSIV